MKKLSVLVAQYREALVAGALLAPERERPEYASHSQELERLESLLSSGSTSRAAAIVKGERRAFGWSFLSGSHGERVETAFHALASALEQNGAQVRE